MCSLVRHILLCLPVIYSQSHGFVKVASIYLTIMLINISNGKLYQRFTNASTLLCVKERILRGLLAVVCALSSEPKSTTSLNILRIYLSLYWMMSALFQTSVRIGIRGEVPVGNHFEILQKSSAIFQLKKFVAIHMFTILTLIGFNAVIYK